MKNASFAKVYNLTVITAGILFALVAITAYLINTPQLIFIGLGVFMAVTMTMTSLYASRRTAAVKGQVA